MIALGIDCGTQSTKTIAVDCADGSVIASARRGHDLISGLPPGAMEQHPSDWADAASETVSEVVASLGERRAEIAAIGVSGQQHGLVALDGGGRVVRPAKLWCDTTTSAQCAAITEAMGGSTAVIEAVGNAMLPGYTAPKIRWLAEKEPENWARTKTVVLPHDYLNFWLTGTARMEYGDASGTALLDVKSREWHAGAVAATADGLAEKLPPVGSSAEAHGALSPELGQRWGLRDGVVVSAGGGDNMMGAIGTGNVRAGVVTASLGTSGTLYAFSGHPAVDALGEVAGFCDSTDHWLPLACTMNVTLVTELAREMFGWDHGRYDAAVRDVPPGGGGLLLLPYLAGERTPNLPSATGTLAGLTTENFRAAPLARAAMEGVTLGLGYGLSRFSDLGICPDEIRLTGGGSASAAWRQICADVFGVPVVCLRTGEGAAIGAAIQAAAAAGAGTVESLAAAWVRPDESTRAEPSPDAVAVYRETAKRAQALRAALAAGGLL